MKSSKNAALVVLTLTTCILGVVAWREYAELQRLRALASTYDQLQQHATAEEKRANALQTQLTAAAKSSGGSADKSGRGEADGGPPGRGRFSMANAAAMMDRPEMQKMMALRQRAALDARYAALFKQLGLAPEKLDQLKNLMVERQQVGSDVFAAAIKQGLDPMQDRAELMRLTADGQSKVEGEIKALLGDNDYSEYENYQATLPQRSLVNQLQQSLSYTADPLTDTQSEQLVQILAQNQLGRTTDGTGQNASTRMVVATGAIGPGGDMGFVGPAMGGTNMPVTDAAIAAARSVLSEPQVAALQALQTQQAQIRAAMQSMGPPADTKPGGGG